MKIEVKESNVPGLNDLDVAKKRSMRRAAALVFRTHSKKLYIAMALSSVVLMLTVGSQATRQASVQRKGIALECMEVGSHEERHQPSPEEYDKCLLHVPPSKSMSRLQNVLVGLPNAGTCDLAPIIVVVRRTNPTMKTFDDLGMIGHPSAIQ